MTTTDTALLTAPTVPLSAIHQHPANPRINAVAGPEMVESVRSQGVLEPVMVAPAGDDTWVLLDGHRRLSAADQAGLIEIPVNPRYDLVTEAQQVEVMVVTGLQKELLSPVEEAAGYEQLALLGMDDAAIAAATGYSRSRVRSRRKLSALPDQVRTGVHDGAITLTDIEALAEFADSPDDTNDLEAALGTPNFRARVHEVRARRQRLEHNAELVAMFRAAGGVEIVSVPGTPGAYTLTDDETRVEHTGLHGMHRFDAPFDEPAAHKGCLGYDVGYSPQSVPRAVCLNATQHPEFRGHLRPTSDPVQSDWEKNAPAREAERLRRDAASTARAEWLSTYFAGLFPTKSHQGLAAAAKAFLPLAVDENDEPLYLLPAGSTATAALAAFGRHLAGQVNTALDTDSQWTDDPAEIRHVLELWDWARSVGYELSDVDVEFRTRLETKLAGTDEDVA